MGEAIFLLGSASEVGAVQGQWQQSVLRERVGRVLVRADETKTTQILRERSERFADTLRDVRFQFHGMKAIEMAPAYSSTKRTSALRSTNP